MSLIKSFATISGFTVLSRVFGLVRDVFIARYLGAGMLTDAFFVAFKLPNFFRRLFAEGAFSAAFVPLFSSILENKGQAEAKSFAEEIMAVLITVLIILSIIVIIFMPVAMYVLAPGFAEDPAKFDLSITLTRITFPYLLFISLVALLGGVLNSLGKFAAFAAAPVIMNIVMIASLVGLRHFTETPAHALAIGVFFAGAAQLLWMIWFCKKVGFVLRPRYPRITDAVRKLVRLMLPAMLGAGVAQVNILVDVIIGSMIPNAVSYLYFADRINELPLGVIGIAIGTALLPLLSKLFQSGKNIEAIAYQNRGLELAFVLSLPCCIALTIIPLPITTVLFQRGAFTMEAADASAGALAAYAFGLPAFVMVKILATAFFANHDTKTPVKIAIACVIINFLLNIILMGPFKHVGLAASTSIAGWVNAGLMAHILIKRGLFVPDERLRRRAPRIVWSSIIMGLALWGLQETVWASYSASEATRTAALGVIIVAGSIVVIAAGHFLKAFEVSEISQFLRRNKANGQVSTPNTP